MQGRTHQTSWIYLAPVEIRLRKRNAATKQEPIKPFPNLITRKYIHFSAADFPAVCHFAADCCFTLRLLVLDYQSVLLEMQREEANQRLRELEEGENYFIILPDSRRRVRQRRPRVSKYNKVYNKDRISQISPEASFYRGTAVMALRMLPLSFPASSQLLREIDMLEIQFQIERSCRESAEALAVKVKLFGS